MTHRDGFETELAAMFAQPAPEPAAGRVAAAALQRIAREARLRSLMLGGASVFGVALTGAAAFTLDAPSRALTAAGSALAAAGEGVSRFDPAWALAVVVGGLAVTALAVSADRAVRAL